MLSIISLRIVAGAIKRSDRKRLMRGRLDSGRDVALLRCFVGAIVDRAVKRLEVVAHDLVADAALASVSNSAAAGTDLISAMACRFGGSTTPFSAERGPQGSEGGRDSELIAAFERRMGR
jgi:hypothetical protein